MSKMCNGCEFLNIDEYEQDLIKEKCGDCPPHICKKYNFCSYGERKDKKR